MNVNTTRAVRKLGELSQKEAAAKTGNSLAEYRALENMDVTVPKALSDYVMWREVLLVLAVNPAEEETYQEVLGCSGMRVARNMLGMTTEEFSEFIDTPYGTVSAWMVGQQEPLRRSRLKVAGRIRDAVMFARGRNAAEAGPLDGVLSVIRDRGYDRDDEAR